MSVSKLNDHVIIPHAPDWSWRPRVRRIWDSGIDSAVNGSEERIAMRKRPRIELRYRILVYDHIERAQLEDRLRAARGKVAVPFWGRGFVLDADAAAGATELKIKGGNARYMGDYVFLQAGAYDTQYSQWEAIEITDKTDTLTLASSLTYAYSAEDIVWDVLFGRLSNTPAEVLNRTRMAIDLRVQAAEKTDEVAYHAVCSDPDKAEDDFENYDIQESRGTQMFLDYQGCGWDGEWVIRNYPWEQVEVGPEDDFESYSVEDPISSTLNGGTKWDGPWVVKDYPWEQVKTGASDDFESYAVEDPISSTLGGGSGWSGDWTVKDYA